MAGGGENENMKFTGLSKHFNSYTTHGRANVVKATYASMILGFIAYKFWPSKKDKTPK